MATATASQMLAALHKADPKTLNKRYSDAELKAAYSKLPTSGAKSGGTSGSTTNNGTGGSTTTGANGGSTTQTGDSSVTDPALLDKYKDYVNTVLKQGTDFGQGLADKYFAPGSMGRVSEDIPDSEKDILGKLNDAYTKSLTMSDDDKQVRDKLVSATNGIDDPSNNALREQMREASDRDYLNNQAQITSQNARYNVLGPAATMRMQNAKEAHDQAAQVADRDLLVQNVNLKQNALNSLQNYQTTLDSNMQGNQRATLGALGTYTSNTEAEKMARTQYNQSNQSAENAGAASATLGGAGIWAGLLGGAQSQDSANANMKNINDIANRQMTLADEANKRYIAMIGSNK